MPVLPARRQSGKGLLGLDLPVEPGKGSQRLAHDPRVPGYKIRRYIYLTTFILPAPAKRDILPKPVYAAQQQPERTVRIRNSVMEHSDEAPDSGIALQMAVPDDPRVPGARNEGLVQTPCRGQGLGRTDLEQRTEQTVLGCRHFFPFDRIDQRPESPHQGAL